MITCAPFARAARVSFFVFLLPLASQFWSYKKTPFLNPRSLLKNNHSGIAKSLNRMGAENDYLCALFLVDWSRKLGETLIYLVFVTRSHVFFKFLDALSSVEVRAPSAPQ